MARPEKVAVVDRDPHEGGGSRRDRPHRVPRPHRARPRSLAGVAAHDAAPSTRCSTRWRVEPSQVATSRAWRRSSGPVAIAFVRGDAAAAAKALREFGKDNPALILKGGLLGTRSHHAPVDLEALADLPSREVMLAQVAGVFQAPLDQGRRAVPGVHPQLRVRREGAHRPAHRGWRSRRPLPRSKWPEEPRESGARAASEPAEPPRLPRGGSRSTGRGRPPRKRPRPRRPSPNQSPSK